MSGPEIILDISRLLSRGLHATPTGVDRVEMAYARELLRQVPDRLAFGAVLPGHFYGRVPGPVAQSFLNAVEARWNGDTPPRRGAGRWLGAAGDLMRLRPRAIPRSPGSRVLIQASPHHLDRQALVAAILRREMARFLCLVHDLIPIEYPEYARPDGPDLHRRRIDTVAALADGVIANSAATRDSFLPHLARRGRDVPVRVAPLGMNNQLSAVVRDDEVAGRRPYFVCLGTIEPRKNHLLLLNIWRRLLTNAPETAPALVIIGRRGWENENVIDMLDRCPVLKAGVEEHAGLADDRVAALLAGARALLMPSFAEGFGLPIPEALSSGVPVICSDLPAHREAGGDAPEYLDPLDGLGWIRAISAYAEDASPQRNAQIRRIARWSPPGWHDHFEAVLEVVAKMSAVDTQG